mmetsp:Transcript_21880/g.41176  ORF Transcript_21880/g.41176 Transcript_21880/m.41176 type:complete len:773 (-) Transcript_21880:59-2377(-)
MSSSQPSSLLSPPLIVFLLSMSLYIPTLCPTIAGGDAGELVAEGCTLGTAHPPGYPTFTLLTYLLTSLPLPLRPAYIMNLSSALLGSLTSSYITSSVLLLSPSPLPSLFSGLFNTISPLTWQYSVTSEVFSLNNFLTTLITHNFLSYLTSPSPSFLYKGAFLSGLSLTNQHTSILFIVPSITYLIYIAELLHFNNRRKLLICAGLFLVGFSSYVTMPIFAVYKPHLGAWGDVKSLGGWMNHFRRADYGTFQLFSGDAAKSEGNIERTVAYLVDLASKQGGPGVFFLGIWGICACVGVAFGGMFGGGGRKGGKGKRKNYKEKNNQVQDKEKVNAAKAVVAIFGCWVFYLCVFHTLANLPLSNPLLYGVHQRFWMQPNILFFIFAGVGGGKFAERFGNNVTMVTLAAIVFYTVFMNYSKVDLSDDIWFDYYARSVLEALPRDSLLVINYDQQWTSVRYLQECEGVRPDIISVNLSMMSYMWWKTKVPLYEGIVNFPGTNYVSPRLKGTGFTWRELLDANIDMFEGGIYLGGNLNYKEDDYLDKYEIVPWGLSKRFAKRNELTTGSGFLEWVDTSREKIHELTNRFETLPDTAKYDESTWEWTLQREYWDHLYERTSHLLEILLRDGDDAVPMTPQLKFDLLIEVAASFELILGNDKLKREEDYGLYKNLGLCYMHMIKSDKGLSYGTKHFSDKLINFQGTDLIESVSTLGFPVVSPGSEWRNHATDRWSTLWRKYLEMDGAENDGSYQSVKSILTAVFQSVGEAQQARAAQGGQ